MARKFFYVCVLVLSIVTLPTAARAQVGEVAILTGVLASGATIPLPTYADGTQALESECHWFVSINSAIIAESGFARREKCSAEERVITAYWSPLEDGTIQYAATVNYMIIAVRAGAPTPTRAGTWGQVKSRYAPTGGTVSKGADTK